MRILIVEDNELQATDLEVALRLALPEADPVVISQGIDTYMAATQSLRGEKARYDIAIIDLVLMSQSDDRFYRQLAQARDMEGIALWEDFPNLFGKMILSTTSGNLQRLKDVRFDLPASGIIVCLKDHVDGAPEDQQYPDVVVHQVLKLIREGKVREA
jgi:hypothetical protein